MKDNFYYGNVIAERSINMPVETHLHSTIRLELSNGTRLILDILPNIKHRYVQLILECSEPGVYIRDQKALPTAYLHDKEAV